MKEQIEISNLFNTLLNSGFKIKNYKSYELIENPNISILVQDNIYKPIKYISRHKTTKDLIKIICKHNTITKDIIITTDHVCLIYNRNHFFENTAAKYLKINDLVSIYDDKNNTEVIGTIINIENIGKTSDYVYDIEVNDNSHVFYGNDILIHNSNFLNIECLTTAFRKQYSLPEKINSWSDKDKLKLWKVVDDFIENDLNNHMQKLIAEKCFSEETSMLRYSLEYIGDCGIYEAKKHYCVHKIVSEGPELVDQIKSVGIELKKTVLPAAVKSFLIDIYENTLKNDWDENDFRHYINKCYDEFCKLSINDVGIWKGWNSDKIEAEGFLKTGKGTTGISKACRYYNDVITEMGIAKKYNTLTIGHKYRFAYLNPNNIYRIDCIAFEDGQWPKEFNDIFNVDYDVMFQKEILQPLKRYLEATRFQNVDPRQRTLFDLNDL